jgi:hypothetical protein
MNWKTSLDGNLESLQYSEEYGWFDRFNDFALILSDDGEDPVPDLECDGELSWSDVKPGTNVTGSFEVRNNGAADSILHWKVESYPTDWGTNWTFTPNASILTIGAGWLTVDVEVVAPEEQNEEFTGEIKLINAEDPDDTCTIPVSLVTPCESPNQAFIEFLMQRFPILGQILNLIL